MIAGVITLDQPLENPMAFPDFPTDDDVMALIRHQYAAEDHSEILALLAPIKHSGHMGWSPARIRLAALVLSDGNRRLIPQWITLGNEDCRDFQLAASRSLGPSWERECLSRVSKR